MSIQNINVNLKYKGQFQISMSIPNLNEKNTIDGSRQL